MYCNRFHDPGMFGHGLIAFFQPDVHACRKFINQFALRELIYEFTAGMHIGLEERNETVAEHTRIMEAIAVHDPAAAARAAETHLASFEIRLKEVWHDLDAVQLNIAGGSAPNGRMGGE